MLYIIQLQVRLAGSSLTMLDNLSFRCSMACAVHKSEDEPVQFVGYNGLGAKVSRRCDRHA